jgi:hypothetical protein
MKITTMRNRLHEAISLAPDEKIRLLFESLPVEISRSEFFTLEQIREVLGDAENFIRQNVEDLREDKKEDAAMEKEKIKRMKEFLFVLFKDDDTPASA